MPRESVGCFAWCLSFKKSCNERWARFRNRFRQRFYSRRGQSVDPATVLNETGTSDMVISKTRYKSNKVMPLNIAPTVTVKDEPVVTDQDAPATDTDDDFDKLVAEYVSGIIHSAVVTLRQASSSKADVSVDNVADDNMSLSSSVISQMAETAVTESLTNILQAADINQSPLHITRPKTAKEVMIAEYVSGIIHSAVVTLRQASSSKADISMDNVADDNMSLSSSVISQMADTAVTESLTNILQAADINQSAVHITRHKTVKEFMKALGSVSGDAADDGLPPVFL